MTHASHDSDLSPLPAIRSAIQWVQENVSYEASVRLDYFLYEEYPDIARIAEFELANGSVDKPTDPDACCDVRNGPERCGDCPNDQPTNHLDGSTT